MVWIIKEQPLIHAVDSLGPQPAWIGSHPTVAGFMAMIMVAAVGASALWIISVIGTASPPEVAKAMRFGAVLAVGYSSIIYGLVLLTILARPEEFGLRLLFVLGGALSIGVLYLADQLLFESVIEWARLMDRQRY